MLGDRLFFKFIGIELLAFFALLFAILGGYGMHRFNSLGSELSADLASSAYRLSGALGPLIDTGNVDAIRSVLTTLSGNRSVECVMVSMDSDELASWPIPDCQILIPTPYAINLPVATKNGKEVTLMVGYTDEWVRETVWREFFILMFAIVVAGIALAITCMVAYHLAIGQGLKKLTRAIETRRLSGERQRAEWDANDALGDVARGYNAMLAEDARREQENTDLRTSEAEAQAANRAKSAFVANVSHEFRTPLNAILGLADLMLSQKPKEDHKQYLELVQDAGQSLLNMVDNVLAFSKLEDGSAGLEIAPYSPIEICQETARRIELHARDKGISFMHACEASVPPILLGDAVQLRRIVMNLVDNAIKFTHSGEISLIFSAHPRSGSDADMSNEHILNISVSDTGVGMNNETMVNVFDHFDKIDTSKTGRHGGVGLGLATTYRLVRLMGGNIDVQSAPDQGTRFTVTLPCHSVPESEQHAQAFEAHTARPENAMPMVVASTIETSEVVDPGAELPMIAPPEPARDETPANADTHILVVDDSTANLLVATELLKSLGYTPHEAHSGAQATELVQNETFDLILMDLQMPDIDGIQAAQDIIAACPEGEAPPIIALTANATAECVTQCHQSGMCGFLTKPINAAKLTNAIDLALRPHISESATLWALDRTSCV